MMYFVYQMLQQMNEDRNRRETDGNIVRLNPLEMPVFHGRVGEDLYRFIDQLSHFLNTYVRPTGMGGTVEGSRSEGLTSLRLGG